MNELFKSELLKDEEIIWSGQPNTAVVFTGADAFLVPFSILWSGFIVFWEISAIKTNASFSFCLFGVPFILIGLYFVFGRFIYKAIKKKHTFYAVTNQRVIILSNIFNKTFHAEFIKHIPCTNKSVRSDGVGTIKFGNSSFFIGMYGNTGMDLFGASYTKDIPVFYDIKDADHVYRIVNEIRQG